MAPNAAGTTGGGVNDTFSSEVGAGERFEFGENWKSFLERLSEERIAAAEASLIARLGSPTLAGTSLIDIGSGSGLFSLAARRLGARVTSFDYDPSSVACAEALRERFYPGDPNWVVVRGSVLDPEFVASLGSFDIVYSWGVLHHTGAMWTAIGNAASVVDADRGRFVLAIYNDQGYRSRLWLRVKRAYNAGPVRRFLVKCVFYTYWALDGLARDIVRGRNPVKRYSEYTSARGMSVIHDWRDWLGGLPFEVAKPEEILHFLQERGFRLVDVVTVGGGLGNNEFVFERG